VVTLTVDLRPDPTVGSGFLSALSSPASSEDIWIVFQKLELLAGFRGLYYNLESVVRFLRNVAQSPTLFLKVLTVKMGVWRVVSSSSGCRVRVPNSFVVLDHSRYGLQLRVFRYLYQYLQHRTRLIVNFMHRCPRIDRRSEKYLRPGAGAAPEVHYNTIPLYHMNWYSDMVIYYILMNVLDYNRTNFLVMVPN